MISEIAQTRINVQNTGGTIVTKPNKPTSFLTDNGNKKHKTYNRLAFQFLKCRNFDANL